MYTEAAPRGSENDKIAYNEAHWGYQKLANWVLAICLEGSYPIMLDSSVNLKGLAY